LESDLTVRATQELALDQAAVLQLQRIGPRDRGRQTKSNDQSAIQLELHDDFSAATIRLRKIFYSMHARCMQEPLFVATPTRWNIATELPSRGRHRRVFAR